MPGEYPLRAGTAVSGGHIDSAAKAAGKPRRRAGRMALAAGTALGWLLPVGSAVAAGSAAPLSAVDVIQFAVVSGVMGAALLSAIFLIRERGRTAAENVELRSRLADVNAALQRSESMLNLREQRVVVWSADTSAALEAALGEVFDEVRAVPYPVQLGARAETYWLYVARVAQENAAT